MKRSIALLCLLTALQSSAQKNIDGLISAEKNFAAYSVAHGTKDASCNLQIATGLFLTRLRPLME